MDLFADGGIRVSGENRFEISPVVGGSLTHASLSYRRIYGRVFFFGVRAPKRPKAVEKGRKK